MNNSTTMTANEATVVTSNDTPVKSDDVVKPKGAPRKRGGGKKGGPQANGINNKPDYWRTSKPAFREWLTNITTRDEYNSLTVLERSALLRDFGVSQQGVTALRPPGKAEDTPKTSPPEAEPADEPVAAAE